MNLDDLKSLNTIDTNCMLASIKDLPGQLADAYKQGGGYKLPQNKEYESIIIAGMGGYAIGAGVFGAIESAQESGFYAIGVDTDMDGLAPGTVLTSMLKHVDVGVFETIKAAYEGKFEPGYKLYDLSDDGVGITEMKFTQDIIPADLLSAVDVLAMKIKTGEIIVPMTIAEANVFILE